MGALLKICCIFSEDLFSRPPLEGYFCTFCTITNFLWKVLWLIFFNFLALSPKFLFRMSYWIPFVKNVQIQNFFWSVFSPNAGKYGPEKTPYLDTFHGVILVSNSKISGFLFFEIRNFLRSSVSSCSAICK